MSIIFESHDKYSQILNSIIDYTEIKDKDNNIEYNASTDNKQNKNINNLLVLDIDNTLLRCPNNFDHDVFYVWQLQEIFENGPYRFFKNKDRLLDFMYDMWLNVNYILCEETILTTLNKLKDEYNYEIIFLTARHVVSECSLRKMLITTQLSNLLSTHLTDDYIDNSDNSDVYNICGVLYTGGKNKGEVLQKHLSIIANNNNNVYINNIVFVDDSISNLHKMITNVNNIKCILYTGSFIFNLDNEWKNDASNSYFDYVKKILDNYH
jgi:hypothetical protein